MLRLRICPNCGNKIESLTALFCYHCGAELTRTITDQNEVTKTVPPLNKSRSVGRVLWLLLIISFGLFGLILMLLAGKKGDRFSSADQTANVPKIIKFGSFNWKNPEYLFVLEEYARLVPAKVDLYFESRGPADFLKVTLVAEKQKQLETILGLGLTEAESYFEGTFAFVQQSSASAFLAKVKDRNFVEKKMKEVDEEVLSKEFPAVLIENNLIVSNSPSFLAEIEEVSRKERLNLNLSAAFAEGVRKLPRRGQAFLFAPNRSGLMAFIKQIVGQDFNEIKSLQLKGSAFVLASEGNVTYFKGTVND